MVRLNYTIQLYFLDIAVSIKNGITETDIYIKPTGSYQYLLSSSYHPFQCIKDTLYSQALRLNRICSNNNFDESCNNFKRFLLTEVVTVNLKHLD